MLSRGHPDDKLGEPLNIIVSSLSSDDVLTAEGFLLWVTALGFGVSCLGQGDDDSFQYANLGKGNENVKQGSLSGNNGVLRWNYGLPSVGTCRETIEGGNHMRWFMQRTKNGTAIFLASSYEKGLDQHHTIEPNGYNRGRDDIVGIATRPEGVEWNGFKYNASAEWIPAGRLLNATSEGINHPDVAPPNGTAIDGRVALLKVNTLQKNNDEKRSSSSGMSIQPQLCVAALLLLMTTAVFLGM
ncbi:hypothetical protein MVES1_001899 [Malassezia vespertilionis]|uniref:Uncharacterized protein n=1 Tax=Malassezia vespertilionis TaxID=2020962 RepID=A0A2N1JD71_9BASI|nr:uncharacterized protein MVES1_001899 [Malassezia vespertilionis]PKI84472.1 hypothetical protein MVES_001801 [Malassezia vespertilionis]WFD06548.1 hypothetical protein MVES1_001899 [Malassezia vespertilionis]